MLIEQIHQNDSDDANAHDDPQIGTRNSLLELIVSIDEFRWWRNHELIQSRLMAQIILLRVKLNYILRVQEIPSDTLDSFKCSLSTGDVQ